MSALVACGPRISENPRGADDAEDTTPRVAAEPLPGASLSLVPHGTRSSDADERVFEVEIAATDARRERGLMGRESLGKQSGMLFVYREPGPRSFWMKGCLIGLDIAFLDSGGRILRVATLPPGIGLMGSDVPSSACDGAVSLVLELRARRFAELGVGTGDLVDVRAAVEGVDPE